MDQHFYPQNDENLNLHPVFYPETDIDYSLALDLVPYTVSIGIKKSLNSINTGEVHKSEVVHSQEIFRVLDRAVHDNVFCSRLLDPGSDALDDYKLTSQERAALVTGDVRWIKKHTGPLSKEQESWFDQRNSAEIW